MNKVAIITDSTADIPTDIAKKLGIIVLPLTVYFGDEQYKDGFDLSAENFYKKMSLEDNLPTTSQITPHVFEEEFSKLLSKGYSVVCITLSSTLSGTFQSANIAKRGLDTEEIEIIDSRTASMGYGLIVIECAKMALEGKAHREICDLAKEKIGRMQIYGSLENLDNLKKGGRIGTGAAIVGAILNIKPIISIKDGKVELVDKVRGSKKANSFIIDAVLKSGADFSKQVIAIVHGGVELARLDEYKKEVCDILKPKDVIITIAGSVIGTHAGAGFMSICFESDV